MGKALLTLLVAMLTATGAAGQSVRGTLQDGTSGAPVAGALVLLVDGQGMVRAQTLSDARGGYALTAPAAGSYTLRVQRIGFRDVEVPALALRPAETVVRTVRMGTEAIALSTITAEARRRCVVRPEQGLVTATLWEEARKALAVTAYTEGQRRYRYTVSRYTRELDPASLRVLREERQEGWDFVEGSPFVSLPVEHLLTRGFVEASDSGPLYHAPDARVLLSDAFLDAYCFRAASPDGGEAGLIGLAFEPAARRGPAAVRGTLWLDANTFELRHLDYRYTRVTLPEGPVENLGGRVEFEPLPDGTWIVRRWRIRMPVVQERVRDWAPAGARRRLVLARIAEQGADVLETADLGGRLLRTSPQAILRGLVFDSAAGAPLAGASVRLIGTAHRAVTDSTGRYRLDDLAPGEYLVTFTHGSLARYDLEPLAFPLTITAGAEEMLDMAVPAGARPAPDSVARLAIVVRLSDWESGAPLADAVVTLRDAGVSAVSNAAGDALVPPVPAGAHRVRVEHVAYGSFEQEIVVHEGATTFAVRVPAARLRMAEIEVRVRPAAAEARRVRGVAVNLLTRAEIAEVAAGVSHVGQLATRFPGLTLQEAQTNPGRLSTGFCIQNRRGVSLSGRDPCVVVVLDDIPIRDTSLLLTITPEMIESIEYLNALEAGPRFGTVSTAGVLVVYTKGNGPYRQEPP